MRIGRVETKGGDVVGVAVDERNNYFRLHGDLQSGYQAGDESVDVQRLLSPIAPSTIYCIGLNYRKHAEEGGMDIPEQPVMFMKSPTSVIGPGATIELPTHLASYKVDYECELAVVIGRRAKNVSPADALKHVLGYTCANDVSARDWQIKWGGGQWCRGKTFDTFCPLGPFITTADEIDDPQALQIKTILNDQVMQDWTTGDMIFSVAELVSFLSGSTTLLPGTVILTGTPHGVGFARNPPRYLTDGDHVAIEISQIGKLENRVGSE